ncbi:MAG: 3-isopropylmalate dehydrogenase [Acidimicrobiia bacterium]|nr:3-isopropylmalate dehydrogenase [Acidimicrobiia bacterium]
MNAGIVLLPGDGIGPEVIDEAERVLMTIADRFGHSFTLTRYPIGGIAIDSFGTALPEETLRACAASDAVLLGAVGGPKWDDPSAAVRPEQGLLRIRREMGLFANLRPITVFPQLAGASPLRPEIMTGVDILFVRELTGGIYFGEQRHAPDPSGEIAHSTMTYTTGEIERIVRVAAEAARTRRKHVTSVDKANVLEVSRLWRRTAGALMGSEYPDLDYDVVLVDAMAMHLISRPAAFDVVVTGNLFGDILTDLGSMMTGSLGMLPSASLGNGGPGLFEPIHGSAPDIAGQDRANPLATILAAAMLLRHGLDLPNEASAIETAVSRVLDAGIRTADIATDDEKHVVGTNAMASAVIGEI